MRYMSEEADPEGTSEFPMHWFMNHPWMAARFFRTMARQKTAEKEQVDKDDKKEDETKDGSTTEATPDENATAEASNTEGTV